MIILNYISEASVVNTTTELQALYDNFELYFRSFEVMQQDTNHDIFVSIISYKSPRDVLLQLALQGGSKQEIDSQ